MREPKIGKRRGRPPLPEGEKRRASTGFRPTPEVRRKLEIAAQANGRSLSQEIESRLERTFLEDKSRYEVFGGKETYGLMRLLAAALNMVEQRIGKRWDQDFKTRRNVEDAFGKILKAFGGKEPSGLRRLVSQDIGSAVADDLLASIQETCAESVAKQKAEKKG